MSVVESRYAEALLSCALSPEEADNISNLLREFSASMDLEEWQGFFLNPAIDATIKRELVTKLFPADTSKTVMNFLCLLIDKGRLSFLPGILSRYETQRIKLRNTLPIVVHSAQAMSPTQLEEIKATYMQKYGATAATIQNELNPGLLGGICVQIGDIRVDDTIQSRLRGLYAHVLDDIVIK